MVYWLVTCTSSLCLNIRKILEEEDLFQRRNFCEYILLCVSKGIIVSVFLEKVILSQDLNPFHASGLFLYPLKTRGFLMFSGGIERDQWHEMCYGLGLKYNFFKKHLHNYSRGIE